MALITNPNANLDIGAYNRMRFQQSQGANPTLPESGARGIDQFRANHMRDQISLQSAQDALASLGEWASDAFGSFFGGSQPAEPGQPAAAEAPVAADPAAPVESSQSFQSAAIDSLGATGNDLLRSGSSGPEVEALQEMLKAEGYDLGEAGVDGQFGPKTKAAVEAFQRDQAEKAENPDHVSAVDGIVGAQTRASLGNAALERASEMDSTVDKLNAGGERGGPDAARAESATEARDSAAKAKADSVMDNHADRNAAPSPGSSSTDRAEKADEAAGGEAASGGTSV